ncbi:Polysaccharide biosynthesis protein [Nocardioides dokdonensis FR1436]|uniref:Polysaccharide biosynthesis protein n=1 Tax=Nocardioides dokdonensis FR1436 TaxID=1300347 RepID=A0A1A9GIR3_9ACTN|nr:oligosaccharide flippase family protein [Nocardioides dokdonensis]ANH38197.1 Polysaccharide biosynthesis protein [Nocardioides dokdonensis FR1436]
MRRGKSVVQVAGGNVSAQVLALLALPLLSRLYSPEAFGALSVVVAVSMLLSSIMTLRLEAAIANALDAAHAKALARLGLCVSGVIATLLLVVGYMYDGSYISLALSTHYLRWTILCTLLTSAFVILSQLFIWEGKFRLLGWRSFWQGLVATLASLLLGVAGVGIGLIAGQILGRIAAISVMAAPPRGRGRSIPFSRAIRIPGLWQYPVLFTPAALLNIAGSQLPLLLTAAWFGAEAAGLLGVAQRVLVIPAAVVGLAISQVFLGKLAEIRRSSKPDQGTLTRSILAILIPIGAAITLAAIVLAPLADWMLGEEWAGVSDYIRATSVVFGFSFIAAPLQQVLVANARGAVNLGLDASRVAMVLGAALVAREYNFSAINVVLAMSIAQGVNYILTIWAGWRSARVWDERHADPVPD